MLFYCKFWKIWQKISRWLLLVIEWFYEELLLPVGGKNLMFQHYFAIIPPLKLILQYVSRIPVTSINSIYFLVFDEDVLETLISYSPFIFIDNCRNPKSIFPRIKFSGNNQGVSYFSVVQDCDEGEITQWNLYLPPVLHKI